MSEQLPKKLTLTDRIRNRAIDNALNNSIIRSIMSKIIPSKTIDLALQNTGEDGAILAKILANVSVKSFETHMYQIFVYNEHFNLYDNEEKAISTLIRVINEASSKKREDISLAMLNFYPVAIHNEELDKKIIENINWNNKSPQEIRSLMDLCSDYFHLFDYFYFIAVSLDMSNRVELMPDFVKISLEQGNDSSDLLYLIPEEYRKKCLMHYLESHKEIETVQYELIGALKTLPDTDRVELYPVLLKLFETSKKQNVKNFNFTELYLTSKGIDEQKAIFENVYSNIDINSIYFEKFMSIIEHTDSDLIKQKREEIFQDGLKKLTSLRYTEQNEANYNRFFKIFDKEEIFDYIIKHLNDEDLSYVEKICEIFFQLRDIKQQFFKYLDDNNVHIPLNRIAEFQNNKPYPHDDYDTELSALFKVFNLYCIKKGNIDEKFTLINLLEEVNKKTGKTKWIFIELAKMDLFMNLEEDDKIRFFSRFAVDDISFENFFTAMQEETSQKYLDYIFVQNVDERNLESARLVLRYLNNQVYLDTLKQELINGGRDKYAYMYKKRIYSKEYEYHSEFYEFLTMLSPKGSALFLINTLNNPDTSSLDYLELNYLLKKNIDNISCKSFQKKIDEFGLEFMSDEKYEQLCSEVKVNYFTWYFYGMQLANNGRYSEAIMYIKKSGLSEAARDLFGKLPDEEKLNFFADLSDSPKEAGILFNQLNKELKKQVLDRYIFGKDMDIKTTVNLLTSLEYSILLTYTDKSQFLQKEIIKQLLDENPSIASKALIFDKDVDREILIELLKNQQLRTNMNAIDINSVLTKMYSESDISKEEFNNKLNNIHRIFTYNNIPEFLKTFRLFQVGKYYDAKNENLTSLQNKSPAEKAELFLGDLFRIALDSNDKSLREFAQILKEGKRITTILQRNPEEMIGNLSEIELAVLYQYRDTLFDLHNFTIDIKENNRPALKPTDNIIEDLKTLTNTYAQNEEKHRNVVFDPHKILDELMGKNVSAQIRPNAILNYMDKTQDDADERRRRYSEMMEKNELHLENGDFIKGIKNFDSYITSLLAEGVKGGEFNKEHSHSDGTPLDADFGYITDYINKKDKTDGDIIKETISKGYGQTYIVMKNYKTRLNAKKGISFDNGSIDTELDYYGYENSAGASYYVRTGIGSNDIDYIVTNEWQPRYGYEMAMAGKFIPVKDMNDNVLFSINDYNKIREQMRGLSYYKADPFVVDEKATKMESLYALYRSVSKKSKEETEVEIQTIKDIIDGKEDTITEIKKQGTIDLIRSYFSGLGIIITDNIGMNLSSNSIELIDTGSTGRGTNIPGDGDFDFMLRHNISPEVLEGFQSFIVSKAESFKTTNDGFRAKGVALENGEKSDIDITYARKNLTLEYSSDMCINDRLHSIEEQDPKKLAYVKANIILAKKILKDFGIYKMKESDGATEYGGFGGIGVENWILQNGGSLEQAMITYLEAANKAESYTDFIVAYPIFNFGNNQRDGYSRHDMYSAFLNSNEKIDGFSQVKEVFTQSLDFIKNVKTPLQESMSLEGFCQAINKNETLRNPFSYSQVIRLIAKMRTRNEAQKNTSNESEVQYNG